MRTAASALCVEAPMRSAMGIARMVSLEGQPKLCDFQMELSFDNKILQLIEIDDQLDMDIVSNGIQERGIVKLNFSRAKNATKGGSLIDMTFKVIKNNRRADTMK